MLNLAGFGPDRAPAADAGRDRGAARHPRAEPRRRSGRGSARAAVELRWSRRSDLDDRRLVGAGEDARGRPDRPDASGPRRAALPWPRELAPLLRAHRRVPDRRRDGGRHHRDRDPAVPDPGRGSRSSRAARRRAAWTGYTPSRARTPRPRDPPRPRLRPAGLRRRGRRRAGARASASEPTCATFAACSPGSRCSASSRPSGSSWPIAGARRHGPSRACVARRSRPGCAASIVGVVVAGVIAFFAFDAAFEVFHRLFFAGGIVHVRPARPTGSSSSSRSRSGRDHDGGRGRDRRDLAARRVRRRASRPARRRRAAADAHAPAHRVAQPRRPRP